MNPPEEQYLSRELCASIAGWRYEDLPQAVTEKLKLLLLDVLGVMGGAAHAPGIAELNARLIKWEPSGSATSLLTSRLMSPPSAALANGAAAHALDFDDQHDTGRVHTTCVVIPALLATAEDVGNVSGKDFLLCMAIGAEIHARLGLTCHNSLGVGWHPTSVFGSLAAALAAARMLRLGLEGMQNALGVAYPQASGSVQSRIDGVLTKRLAAGFAARAGVLAAFLAADGITGTRRSLEGAAGLFELYQRGEVDAKRLTADLGHTWEVLQYGFKPYPCCRANHTVIGLGMQCHNDRVHPSLIASIQIGLGQFNWNATGGKYDASRNDVVHAQFNAAYAFARALIDGYVGLSAYERPAITDSQVVSLTERTRTVVDPAMSANDVYPARVQITLTTGERKELFSNKMKGSPNDPICKEDLLVKFRSCLASGIGASAAATDRLAEQVFTLDSASDAAKALISAFPARRQG